MVRVENQCLINLGDLYCGFLSEDTSTSVVNNCLSEGCQPVIEGANHIFFRNHVGWTLLQEFFVSSPSLMKGLTFFSLKLAIWIRISFVLGIGKNLPKNHWHTSSHVVKIPALNDLNQVLAAPFKQYRKHLIFNCSSVSRPIGKLSTMDW